MMTTESRQAIIKRLLARLTKEELEAIIQLADNAQAKGIDSKRIILALMVKADAAIKELAKEEKK